jgi:hypothetical protein
MSLEIFYEKVAESLLVNAVQKIQAQGPINRPASRLVWREQFIYRIRETHPRLEGKSQCVCMQHQTGKTVKQCTTMYSGPLTYELNSFPMAGRNSSWS